MGRAGNHLSNQHRRQDAGFLDLAAGGGVIACVDAPAGEVDQYIAAVDLVGPWAEIAGIPLDCFPGRRFRMPAQDSDRMAVVVEMAGQDVPDYLIGRSMRDMPILARDKVRFVGEKVAAVAASPRAAKPVASAATSPRVRHALILYLPSWSRVTPDSV